MDILSAKLRVAYDQSVLDATHIVLSPAMKRGFKWFCDSMKQRLEVGEHRYSQEILRYNFPDQEAAIGRDWKRGFTFLALSPHDILRRYREKWGWYRRTGNTENLIDAANYSAFLYLLGAWSFGDAVAAARSCIGEFFIPTIPGAAYRPEDRPDDGTKPITAERREWFARTPGAH